MRWRINGDILDTVLVCLKEKIAVGDLPVMKDFPLPRVPEGVVLDSSGKLRAPSRREDESEEDFKERRKTHYAYKRLVEKVGGGRHGFCTAAVCLSLLVWLGHAVDRHVLEFDVV